ncbi:MAG: imidazoleglycerol-phosphate dehydratase HisB [Saccharofermentanales bacterium]|jgi:imidazoleglycerol-phosphate dehydratase|nr:imidazoleglycerol-phosphate dehydratase HisB [Bacillota bacterium]NLB09445.1 imidazoleglycerol-phosphate dehydratase HisB [Clostridiales bacterium]
MRKADISRKTGETDINVILVLDGTGRSEIDTGVGFLNHMLDNLARHGRFDLTVKAVGDTDVDCHHTTEDIGIVLGEAFLQVLADKRGIRRFGSAIIPMDEALSLVALDFSGREYTVFNAAFNAEKVGDFDTELVEEFFRGFARGAKCNLHIRLLDGKNSHHCIESIFKAFAKAAQMAVALEGHDDIPSTKGVL